MMQDLRKTQQDLSAADIRDELACAGREASLGFDAIVGLYGRFSGVPPPTWPTSPLRRFDTRYVAPDDDGHSRANRLAQ